MDYWDYIAANATADPAKLRLAAAGRKYDFEVADAILQIEARRKFGRKLATTLAACPHFRFPTMLSGEQASSDLLADYHAGLTAQGLTAVDLTAGLGIDALHMCSRAAEVTAIERDERLCEALRANAAGLSVDNIKVECADCREFVDSTVAEGRTYDVAFIDPARRAADGSRVFGFKDCEPDVAALLPKLRQMCRLLVIKASPMLDVTAAVQSLGATPRAVIALGTPTECKELLFLVDFAAPEPAEPMLEAVTLAPDGSGATTFSFLRSRELAAEAVALQPAAKAGDTVCEPSPSVMKLAPFKLLAQTWGLNGFGGGTHLFYRASPPQGAFPGRLFRIEEVLPYASKVIKRLSGRYPAAQIATRNFGISADELRRRLGMRQSDSVRIFGVTDSTGARQLVVTTPLKNHSDFAE